MSYSLAPVLEKQLTPEEAFESICPEPEQMMTITVEDGKFKNYNETCAGESKFLSKNPVVTGLRDVFENTSQSPRFGTLPYINFIFGTPLPYLTLRVRLRTPSPKEGQAYVLQNHAHSLLKSLLILSQRVDHPSQLYLQLQPSKGTKDNKACFINVTVLDPETDTKTFIKTGGEIGRTKDDLQYAIHVLRRWLGHEEPLYHDAIDVTESAGTQEVPFDTEEM